MSAGRPEPPYRLLLVDDSRPVRAVVRRIVERWGRAEVVGEAENGLRAVELVQKAARGPRPVELVLLDVEMPHLDGLATLERLRGIRPAPRVIMLSALTQRGAAVTLRALSRGAADYICKPSAQDGSAFAAFERELLDKLELWGKALRRTAPGLGRSGTTFQRIGPARRDPAPQPQAAGEAAVGPALRALRGLAIGSSTGGPQAVMSLLSQLGPRPPYPIFVVQHMPPGFTRAFADQIAHSTGHRAVEAEDRMTVADGHLYVAPGDFHMRLKREANHFLITLDRSPPLHFCRPAVDAFLESAAPLLGRGLCAVILTGMGQDGLRGCELVTQHGGVVLAQDEASSVVWGMPGAVVQKGLAALVADPETLGRRLRQAQREAA